MPTTPAGLRKNGLPPQALAGEIRHGRSMGVHQLLAGIELVEIKGVAELNDRQIEMDLHAFLDAGVDGFVLSWDLWHIPIDRLGWVGKVIGES